MGLLAHASSGVFEPLQIAGLMALATAYAIRAQNLARDGRPVPPWRMASFFSGIVLIFVAFVSPLAHISGELVLAHMIQHLVIGDIAALLIVLGLTRSVLQPVMSLKAFDKLRVLALPMIALPLWVANLYVWHIPALYDGTVTSEWLHALQHVSFISFGVLMWMPVAGPLPVPSWFGGGAQVGYTILARLAGAGLDVRAVEPPGPSALDAMDNVILTPHVAALTEEAQARVAAAVCRDVAAVLGGGRAVYPANTPAPKAVPA